MANSHDNAILNQCRCVMALAGGECLRRSNVVERQARMVCDDGLGRQAGSELAQHDLDRYARSPDHGLAAHDLRIDLDPLVRHGTARKRAEDFSTKDHLNTIWSRVASAPSAPQEAFEVNEFTLANFAIHRS